MATKRFQINISVSGPFLTHSSSIGTHGIDAPIARTRRNGKRHAYVPFSQLKGRLLQAWQELVAPPPLLALLGSDADSGNPGPASNQSAGLLFEDLISESPAPERRKRRIKVDRERGSVSERALAVLESPFEDGAAVTFAGAARLTRTSNEDVRQWIEWGLKWIGSLGGQRTIGFGRILAVEVREVPENAQAEGPVPGDTFGFALRPQSAFCLSLQRVALNLFESTDVISGGVIKGMVARELCQAAGLKGCEVSAALAQQLPEYAALCRNFEAVQFSHAFPAPSEFRTRPVVPPLSLVHCAGSLFDVARSPKPILINGEAPRFDIDWKGIERMRVRTKFGWPSLERELRVRTAIDGETLRADDEKLFAYEMVQPEGFHWLGRVILTAVADAAERTAVAGQIASLFGQGLHALGKTKSFAEVEYTQEPFRSVFESSLAAVEGRWIVSLNTPALLIDPDAITKATGSDELEVAYELSFSELSNGRLKLVSYFARQSLAGGEYLYRRFCPKDDYQPWLLTNAGSVFVLERVAGTKEEEATEVLKDWLDLGLGLPPRVKDRYGESWKRNPFIRQNGYGEVTVNPQIPDVALPANVEVLDVF